MNSFVRLCARRPGLPVLAVLYVAALALADSTTTVVVGVVALLVFGVRLAMIVRRSTRWSARRADDIVWP